MKNIQQKILAVCLIICLCLALCASVMAEGVTVAEIQKYGNLVLSLKGTDFMRLGYAYGDVITVTIAGKEYEMPVGSNYSDVDNGSLICRVTAPADGDAVILAINMGDLATAAGIAVKTKTEVEPGYRWDYTDAAAQPVTVAIAMKEKGGYYDQYVMHQLVRTNERADYASLTDEEFANFRPVTTSGIGRGRLYRSASPVNPELNRNAYADAAMKAADVKTVVNLADTPEGMKAYAGYADTYYQGCQIIALNLGVDFAAQDFQAGLAQGLRFMAANEGPYLVHCNEGKDRAGFTSAILACLMGATAEEVTADYMITYANYYGVAQGSEQYKVIASSNIEKSLAAAFEVEDIYTVDLAQEAAAYLTDTLGLTEAEVTQLKNNLAE
ncbi:MAG: tyrosine-protein phosphatase [Clostridia bacterium]|nr:tyrosine-protein phosphatase [Clostridia bacterium]